MQRRNALSYRPDIDGLRAFAVLAVALFHAFPTVLRGGFIGVDIFFVISGYLICGIILHDLQGDAFTFRKFYARRIRRIFPALTAVLAATLAFGWFALWPRDYYALGKHIVSGACFFSNFQLWHESGYFDAAARYKPLLHLWSLGIEEQFYIVFPFLLWFCARKRFKTLPVLVGLWLLSFVCNLLTCGDHAVAAFYAPWTRVWEPLTGAVLCALPRRPEHAMSGVTPPFLETWRQSPALRSIVALCGGGGVCLGLALARESDAWPGWRALFPVIGTALLIAAGPRNPISGYIFSNRLAVFIGKVSYPFYLWHWVFISFAFIILGELGEETKFFRVALLTISFILSVFTYLFIERPIRFGKRLGNEKLYVVIIMMIVCACLGQTVRKMDGFQNRDFPNAQIPGKQDILAAMRDESKDKSCFDYTGVNTDELTYCRYSQTNFIETVAVVGDSHALTAYWGITEAGSRQKFNTVLLGWYVPVGHAWYGDQKKNMSIITDILLEKKDIKTIFMIQCAALYMSGKYYYEGNMRPSHIRKSAENKVPMETFKNELQKFVNTMRASGKKIYIVAENPELPASVMDYYASPLALSDPVQKFPTVYREDVLHRQQPYREMLKTIQGAIFIDTLDTFCPGETCPVFTEDGVPLYSDDNHLTRTGSDFLTEYALRPFLPRPTEERPAAP